MAIKKINIKTPNTRKPSMLILSPYIRYSNHALIFVLGGRVQRKTDNTYNNH